jgi:hypothetical protein
MRTRSFFPNISRKVVASLALVWLTATLCLGITLDESQQSIEGLVYCPLQKKWVEELSAPPTPKVSPIDAICSSSKRKGNFTQEILNGVATRFRTYSEDEFLEIFFAYSTEGRIALSRVPVFPEFSELLGDFFRAFDSAISLTPRNDLSLVIADSSGFRYHDRVSEDSDKCDCGAASPFIETPCIDHIHPRGPPHPDSTRDTYSRITEPIPWCSSTWMSRSSCPYRVACS